MQTLPEGAKLKLPPLAAVGLLESVGRGELPG